VPNTELARRGSTAVLARGDSYFNFQLGEAADWLDRTVNVPGRLSNLSVEQWLAEFDRLKKLNAEIMNTAKRPTGKWKQPAARWALVPIITDLLILAHGFGPAMPQPCPS
jgi:hypothetical protein